jgi:large subunit ribosomal protein LP2
LRFFEFLPLLIITYLFALGSVGVEFEKTNAETVVKLLNGKNVEEVISEGSKKLASVPSGGGAAPAAQAGKYLSLLKLDLNLLFLAAPAASAAAPAEDKKKKEEPKEESDEDMGFGLFD